jgi:hypothetical protein
MAFSLGAYGLVLLQNMALVLVQSRGKPTMELTKYGFQRPLAPPYKIWITEVPPLSIEFENGATVALLVN